MLKIPSNKISPKSSTLGVRDVRHPISTSAIHFIFAMLEPPLSPSIYFCWSFVCIEVGGSGHVHSLQSIDVASHYAFKSFAFVFGSFLQVSPTIGINIRSSPIFKFMFLIDSTSRCLQHGRKSRTGCRQGRPQSTLQHQYKSQVPEKDSLAGSIPCPQTPSMILSIQRKVFGGLQPQAHSHQLIRSP